MNMLTRKYFGAALWVWITLGAFAAGGLTAYSISQPQYASWRYGACRAFLDQYVRFPTTIDIKVGGETRSSVVIGFSDTNPYGSEQIRVFECYYSQDSNGRVSLSKVTMDRKPIPDDTLAAYNATLPLLQTQKLDTALPKALPSNLEDLKE